MKSDKEFLATASRLAQQAALKVMELLKGPIAKERKEDRSLVTEADLRSDAILREGLARAFPDHAILTEESGLSSNLKSDWTWLIDPLDGTKAYAKGIPGFSIMVGLLKRGQPHLGVVVDPLEGFVYESVRGGGATITLKGEKKRIEVSKRKEFSEMPLVVSTGFPADKLRRIRGQLRGPLLDPINSVGIKIGLLVRQKADIYVSHHSVHYWDTCAPQVILEEAGGVFTRLDGRPLTYSMDSNFSHGSLTLASNGRCHAELVRLLLDLGLGEA